jgi:hypothetical protein
MDDHCPVCEGAALVLNDAATAHNRVQCRKCDHFQISDQVISEIWEDRCPPEERLRLSIALRFASARGFPANLRDIGDVMHCKAQFDVAQQKKRDMETRATDALIAAGPLPERAGHVHAVVTALRLSTAEAHELVGSMQDRRVVGLKAGGGGAVGETRYHWEKGPTPPGEDPEADDTPTPMKRSLVPRCDVHPDRSMIKNFGEAIEVSNDREVTRIALWRCSVDGCRQMHGERGYYDAASTDRLEEPRCATHSEPMIVQAQGDSFIYVCPVDGCDYTEPYSAPKGE